MIIHFRTIPFMHPYCKLRPYSEDKDKEREKEKKVDKDKDREKDRERDGGKDKAGPHQRPLSQLNLRISVGQWDNLSGYMVHKSNNSTTGSQVELEKWSGYRVNNSLQLV